MKNTLYVFLTVICCMLLAPQFLLAQTPTIQASNVIVTPRSNSAQIEWTRGNGGRVEVFMLAGNSGLPAPVDLTTYAATPTFGIGAQIGATGWYAVAVGDGTAIIVSGLSPSTTYRVMVIEYSNPVTPEYLTTVGVGNPVNFTTLPSSTISSIARAGSATTNASTVNYTVTFSSPVSGLSASNFLLSASGPAGASITSVSGSGTSYTVAVNTGTGNGSLELWFANETGLSADLTNSFPFIGPAYTIDKTLPALSAVSIVSSNAVASRAKPADQVTLSFTAAEVINTPTVTIAGHTVAASNTSGNNWTAAYTMAFSDTEGAIPFSIAYTDAAGNAGTVTATTNSSSVTFDKTSAVLNVVNAASDHTNSSKARIGSLFKLNFTTSEAINTPAVTIAGHTVTATNTGGNNWAASYTMLASDTEGPIPFIISFSDLSGNTTVHINGAGSVTFDKTAPTVSSAGILSNNSNTARARTGNIVTLAFTSSETITSPSVTIAGHAVTATNTGGNNWSAAYTMLVSDTEGIIPFSIAFADAAGNAGTTVTATSNSSSVTFDRTAPVLSGVAISSDNSNTSLARAGNTVSLVFTSSETIASPSVTIAGKPATITNTGGNNWSAAYTMLATDTEGPVPFNIAFSDVTGNAGTAVTATGNGSSVSFDRTAPALSTVGILSNNSNTAMAQTGNSVTLAFTASETITVPAVTIAGRAAIVANTGGNNWSASYTMLATDTEGIIPFSIAFSDAAGNAGTAVTATTNNSSVIFDRTAPVLTAAGITNSTPYANVGLNGTVYVTFTANEALASATVSIAGNAVAAANTSGNTWRAGYQVLAGDTEGAITFSISYADLAGNPGTVVTATTDNSAVAFDKTAPLVSPVSISSNNVNPRRAVTGDVVTLSFTLSEPLHSLSVVMASKPITAVNTGGNNWTASFTVANSDPGGPVSMLIQSWDRAGNPGAAVTASTDNSSVSIDHTYLTSIGLSNGTLSPVFDPVVTDYSASVGTSVGSVTLTLPPGVPTAIVTVNGTAVTGGGTISVPLTVGANQIEIRVTEPGGGTYRVYRVTVTRSAPNTSPTLNPIASQNLCPVTSTQTIALDGITAGTESGQSVTLSVSSTNPGLFDQLSAGAISGGNASLSYRVKGTGTATVTVTVTDDGGTENGGINTFSRSFTITVNPLPTVAIVSGTGPELSLGETATLTASGGSSYSWANAAGIISGQNTATLSIRPAQTTTYTVTATTAAGCAASQTVTITVIRDYAISANNVLTPNGDGRNDVLMVSNIDMYPDNELKIFDRAGRMLYAKKSYNNEWDGTLNGSPLQQDTYYYIIDFSAGKYVKKGFISVIRKQ